MKGDETIIAKKELDRVRNSGRLGPIKASTLAAVEEFNERRYAERGKNLAELTRLSEELPGGYE